MPMPLPRVTWSITLNRLHPWISHSPDPMPLSRSLRTKSTWGAMAPSGSTHLNRMEWGLRGAFLVGPSFNGLEGTLVAEAWGANLLRNSRSDWANFSPYHPIFNGGVFVRYQRGGVLVPSEEDRVFNLLSDTYLIGWRTPLNLLNRDLGRIRFATSARWHEKSTNLWRGGQETCCGQRSGNHRVYGQFPLKVLLPVTVCCFLTVWAVELSDSDTIR